MPETRALAALERLAQAARDWPPILRDFGAAGLAVFCICLGELLAMELPVPAEVLLALPGALLVAIVLGWPSALFALLVSATVVEMLAPERQSDLVGSYAHEPLKLAAMAAGFVAVCIGARLWARRREARAEVLLDACATDAMRRIAAAEAETRAARAALARAEAEVVEARQVLARRRDAELDEARRREGGI